MKKSEILKALDGLVVSYYVSKVEDINFLVVRVSYLGWKELKDIMDYILYIRPEKRNEITIEFDPSIEID